MNIDKKMLSHQINFWILENNIVPCIKNTLRYIDKFIEAITTIVDAMFIKDSILSLIFPDTAIVSSEKTFPDKYTDAVKKVLRQKNNK